MLYLHDIWVSWFEGEENGYNVCHFHEWRKSDRIEILDQAPILYVDHRTYHYIENDLQDIPGEMMKKIYQKAYVRKKQERKKLDYAAIITDGHSILAFDTMGYHIPLRKSRLIPRQERLVLDLIEKREPDTYEIPKMEEKEYHILSLPPEYMIGLTRRERQLKQVLMIAMDQLEMNKNKEEIRYWLTEWSPEKYQEHKLLSFDQAFELLHAELIHGWSDKHEQFCRQLIKGQTYYEHLWEIEQDEFRPATIESKDLKR